MPSPSHMRSVALPGDLPEDYYLTNIVALTRFVTRTHGEFLRGSERDWFGAFETCTESARRLYVRLPGRRGSNFRVGRLQHVEIAGIAAAADELAGGGLVDTAPPGTLAELVPAFPKPEFVEINGPGDALQARQRRWMRRFAAHGIPYRVIDDCCATTTSAS